MSRFFVALALFGLLIYAIFGAALRDRYALELRQTRIVGWTILGFEFILFGILIARSTFVRTPLGIAIAIPLFFTMHGMLCTGAVRLLKKRGWIKPAQAGVPSQAPKFLLLRDASGRSLYIGLAVAYALTAGVLLLIHHLATT